MDFSGGGGTGWSSFHNHGESIILIELVVCVVSAFLFMLLFSCYILPPIGPSLVVCGNELVYVPIFLKLLTLCFP